MTTYNGNYLYNNSTINYSGTSGIATQNGKTLQWNMNRVIGNTMTGPTWYEAQKAANIWADTPTYLDLLGALNYKAGTSGLGLNAVCNLLAGTSNLDADGASEFFS